MPPPAFRSKQRHEGAEETRQKILAAARDLIAAPEGFNQFSIDAVARKAGVARMTVYYQFGSRRELFEALFDDLSEKAGFGSLTGFPGSTEANDVVKGFIHFFCNFWSSERLVLRRLRGLATLDPELGEALAARDARRQMGLSMLVQRVGHGALTVEGAIAAMMVISSFETFDALANSLPVPEVELTMLAIARATLGLATPQP